MAMSRTVLVCGAITLGLLACNGLVGLDGLRTNDNPDASSSGASGTSGSAGTSGSSGSTGTSGTSGTSGSSGASGTSGSSGASGSSGTDGAADTAVDTNPPPPVDAGGTCITGTGTAGHNLTINIGTATRSTGIVNKGTTGFSIGGTSKTVVECLPVGDLVDLRADPDSSPYANSWTGACASSDARKCTLTMTKDATVGVTLQ